MDAWIAFGVTAASSRVVATAKQEGVPSVVCVQSNAGLDPRLASNCDFINECGETSEARRYALLETDEIVCQSDWQLRQLNQTFGKRGVLARNPIDTSRWALGHDDREASENTLDHVLWIGRYDDFHKRPMLMLEAACACPDIPVKMIINPFDAQVERLVRDKCPPNVELIDRVPFSEMPTRFAAAKVFVSTGSTKHEGFPNVLLQAAASHTPIVAMADHDDFLARSGAGVGCNESLEVLVREIRRAWTNPFVDWQRVDNLLAIDHDADVIAENMRQLILGSLDS